MWKSILLMLFCVSAYATDTSASTKSAMYKSCLATCVPNQRKLPENKAMLDVPFVLDTYCSCTCTRYVMRLSAEDAGVLGKVMLEGKGLETQPKVVENMQKNAAICIKALVDE